VSLATDELPDAPAFWSRVEPARGGCWEWQGARNEHGYGLHDGHGRAHRFAFDLVFGSIPPGLVVMHTCDNPPCVNPDHLVLGTKADNTRDMRRKGRARGGASPGETNPSAKLTAEQVAEIRRRWAAGARPGKKGAPGTKKLLADEFGVSTTLIGFIVRGEKWGGGVARAKVQAGGIVRTSLDNSWRTPEWILERVRAYFGGPIGFDPASAPDNPTKAERFLYGAPGTMFSQETGQNGLDAEWPLRGTYANPPYGSELRAWLLKFAAEAARGVEVVTLLPCSRWEATYFQETLARAAVVCLLRGRVAFVSSIDGAEVPGNCSGSMILGFNVDAARFHEAFGPIGTCFAVAPLSPRAIAPEAP
jgi:hypothetical protein